MGGGLARGFVGGAEFGVDLRRVSGGGLLESVGGDGSCLGEDGALACFVDAFEGFEGLLDPWLVEPGVELGDFQIVVVADVEEVDVGGEEVAEEGVFVEVAERRRVGGRGSRVGGGVWGFGSGVLRRGVDWSFGRVGFELGLDCDHGGIVFADVLGVDGEGV